MYLELSLADKADLILSLLKEDYPTVRSPMFHRNAYEILIAVMLSPQTNDEITNQVTPGLFAAYPEPTDLARADENDVFELIKKVNYNRTKTGRIIAAARMLADEFDSKVPHTMPELLKFPGVGRKVANVIINDWYATHAKDNLLYEDERGWDPDKFNSIARGVIEPTGFVVDTHVSRISQVLMLTEQSNPAKIEQDLIRLFPSSEWMGTSLRMIFHGRQVFQAQNPQYHDFPCWREIYDEILK